MRKSNVISLKECYQILQIDKDATLDDVKKAYRKRAFELHPDLNPDTPDAGNQFKILNEAYVALSQILEAEQARQGKRWNKNNQEAKNKAQTDKAKKEQAKQYEKKRAEEQRKDKQTQHQTYTRQQARKQENKETNQESTYTGYTGTAEQNTQQESTKKAASAAYAKEDVLRDLLNDPFARRVFEDIYSEVNKQSESNTEKTEKHTETETITPPPKQSTPKPPPTFIDLKENKTGLHMANSFSDKILGWFKHQIDEEQTIKMPASSLFVGARIRLQIRRGLSDELSTVEIVLPKEFVVGKPLRLRGLGKKVGKWQGDLYLTIESK